MQFDQNKIRQTIGRYKLTQLLGRGTMGNVYRAIDLKSNNPIAIKVLFYIYNKESVIRFKNEVRTMRSLQHPAIVRALSGTIRKCSANHYYFPMELVDGQSLERHLQYEPVMTLAEVIPIIRDVCSALEYAHDQGVIHRDLKPANILIDKNGSARITDFGFAKSLFESTEAETFAVLGARAYCSPGKWRDSSEVKPASDLFSLGVIMYRMFSGSFPFRAKSEGLLRDLIERGQYVPLETLRPDLPERIIKLVKTLLYSDKNSYSGVKQVSDIIEKVCPDVRHTGLAVFPSWQKATNSISALGVYPEVYSVRRTMWKHSMSLICPDCGTKLRYSTYVHDDGTVIELKYTCPCSVHYLSLM